MDKKTRKDVGWQGIWGVVIVHAWFRLGKYRQEKGKEKNGIGGDVVQSKPAFLYHLFSENYYFNICW